MTKKVYVFSSPTCAPCKTLKPLLEHQQQVHGFEMEAIEMKPANAERFKSFGVRAVPTVVCVDGDAEVGRFAGGQTAAGIETYLKEWGVAV